MLDISLAEGTERIGNRNTWNTRKHSIPVQQWLLEKAGKYNQRTKVIHV